MTEVATSVSEPPMQPEDRKACAERIKEISTGATRVALIWFAALTFVWATKIEPSFGPVIRYQSAVKTKKTADKLYRHDLNSLRKTFNDNEANPFEISETSMEAKPGEPSIRWEFRKKERMPALIDRDSAAAEIETKTAAIKKGTARGVPARNEPSPDEAVAEKPAAKESTPNEALAEKPGPIPTDQNRLDRLNRTLRNLTKTSLDAEARKVSATTVDFELLNYKFVSSVLYAPVVWNVFFLGLLLYLFLSRQRLVKLLVRYANLEGSLHLYHVPWWAGPLPRLPEAADADLRRILGWDEGTKKTLGAIVASLVFAVVLQGRVAQIGLAVTQTLGSGREATSLTIAYYAAFTLFVIVILLWLWPTDYRRAKVKPHEST